jgi:hypothetical protein
MRLSCVLNECGLEPADHRHAIKLSGNHPDQMDLDSAMPIVILM